MSSDDRARPSARTEEERSTLSAFRRVPRTGVIFVVEEARARGFGVDGRAWCNLGQGQPETGCLPLAPPRIETIPVAGSDHDYAPVPGLWELREAVASFYNEIFRRGMGSRYSAENVAISGGGRASLTRAAAALGHINLGHFLPDYTAYEELLEVFRLFTPIPILLDRSSGYRFDAEALSREIHGRGLSALLVSNPCNPTGRAICDEELADWIGVARQLDCTLLLDEFYSHYLWRDRPAGGDQLMSAARFVEDVERDPVVIFDGLTKNWRYPGWRVTWTVGPRRVIDAISSAGSFLDGGGCRPMQRAAVDLLRPEDALAETRAIQAAFRPKRDFLLERIRDFGMKVDLAPEGTFYAFVSLEDLPPSLRDCMDFFRAALERQVICVPGVFFDVNPGRRRARRLSRFREHVRLSFGPSRDQVEEGLHRLGEMIAEAG